MTAGGPTVDVTADLSIEVDGLPVRIEGRGAQVRVRATDIDGLLLHVRDAARAVGGPAPRAGGARLADALAEGGLTAVLESPRGPVATLGAGADSSAGALLWGTRHIAVDPVGVLRGSPTVRALVAALAGAALAALALGRARARRASPP